MNDNKKFIIVQDKATADKFIVCGFQLVSSNNNTYTFINSTPQNFSFSEVDVTKIAYTNMLSI